MRRVARLMLSAVAVCAAAARPALAQQVFRFHPPSDTATGAGVGDTVEVLVRHESGNTLNYARLTIHFDPAKVDIIGLRPFNLSGATLVPAGAGAVQVSGSGPAYGNSDLFYLRAVLLTGVTDGTYLWADPDSVQANSVFSTFAYTSGIGRICHATNKWGDVDGNGRVDSRDALITLSSAVGLPVSGFQTAMGDVDADGIVGSRDALMMLSQSIGLTIYASNRVGVAIVDACPGLTAPSESMVFLRWPNLSISPVMGQLMYLAAGSTTPTLVTSDTAFKLGSPRLAADDSTIGYYCYDAVFFSRVCRIQRSGAGAGVITTTSSETVEWSPDGTELLFGRSSELLRMPSGGGTEVPITSGGTAAGSQSWNKDGVRLAYLVQCFVASPACLNIGTVNADGTGPVLLSITGLAANYFREVRWSLAGDSLAFTRLPSCCNPAIELGVFVAGGAGGAARRAVALSGIIPATSPVFVTVMDWGAPGIVFPIHGAGTSNGLWLVDGGGVLRRLTVGDDDAPSFRRTP